MICSMGSCDCSFRSDALDTIISSINQLTFLTATGMIDTSNFRGLPNGKQAFPSPMPSSTVIAVGSNTTAQFQAQPGSATQLTDVVHYQTHYVYAGIAFGVTILCVLLVIPSFWRYGELGRRVTLGPVEIASAFGAPILVDRQRDEARQETIETLIKHIGDRRIQYGFVDVDGDGVMDREEMHLQGLNVAGLPAEQQSTVQTNTQVPYSPMMSPTLSQAGERGTNPTIHKRKSVRLAIGTPEVVRPTSQIFPVPRTPTIPQVKE